MQIQISWLLKKPTDLDLHWLQKQEISGFSRTRVKQPMCSDSIFPENKYLVESNCKSILLYNRVFNCFKQHVYYVSINSFIYYVSKNNFLNPILRVYFFMITCYFQEGQLSVSGERMCTILVNRLED